jgi:hypothetical protein
MTHRPKAKGTVVGGIRKVSDKTPYLKVVDNPRETKGKGSTHSTLYGVIGRTKLDPYMTSLQNVVMNTRTAHTRHAPVLSDMNIMHHGNSERHIIGPKPATHYSGHIYGQVPYPGGYAGGH